MKDEPLEQQEEQALDEDGFPCQKCGALLKFAPGTEQLKCEYCGHLQEFQDTEEVVEEQDFESFLDQALEEADTEDRMVVKCQACAAETTLETNITAAECAYCGIDLVMTTQSKKLIRPLSLLSFKLDGKEARKRFRGWLTKLWFAPNDLKKYAREDFGLNGMYVPYWTYDSEATSRYTGQRGVHYWTTETYTTMENGKSVTRTRQVRKTRWYFASGTVYNSFDDVLVLASNSLPKKYAEKLEPWDLENLSPYQDEYLSGFRAESYQVDLSEGWGFARVKMSPIIRQTVRRDIGGDEQRIFSVKSHYDDITFKHILLPVWMSTYRFKGKLYRFLVNARTGEVQGERPWSFWKIFFAVLGGVAIVAAIILLVKMNQG